MTHDLPQFLRDLLSACPKHGDGVHAWLFRCARQLHAHYTNPGDIIELLSAASYGCGRPIPRQEIESAVENAAKCAWQPGAKTKSASGQSKWPAVNQEQRTAIIREGPKLVDLWEASSVRIDWNGSRTEDIIDRLFPGNPLLCVGRSSREFDTKPREEWRGSLAAHSLIVPSPMSAPSGLTKEGRPSKHTLENTGARRFLVVEFDQGAIDDHAALIFHLSKFGPLVLAVHSGSKSLHGWFFCAAIPEEKLRAFMRYAVSIGADHATWTRSQFVRMPDGTRENRARQAVYFFNPQPLL